MLARLTSKHQQKFILISLFGCAPIWMRLIFPAAFCAFQRLYLKRSGAFFPNVSMPGAFDDLYSVTGPPCRNGAESVTLSYLLVMVQGLVADWREPHVLTLFYTLHLP